MRLNYDRNCDSVLLMVLLMLLLMILKAQMIYLLRNDSVIAGRDNGRGINAVITR